MDERERLQREIEYYQDLIRKHGSGSSLSRPKHSLQKPGGGSRSKVSNKYSLVRNNYGATQGVAHASSSQRTVIKPGSSNPKRTVLKPVQQSSKADGVHGSRSIRSVVPEGSDPKSFAGLTAPPHCNTHHARRFGTLDSSTQPSSTLPNSARPSSTRSSSTLVIPSRDPPLKQGHKMQSHNLQQKSHNVVSGKASQTRLNGNKFKWVNSKILENRAKANHTVATSSVSEEPKTSSQYIKSRYKLTKKNLPVQSPQKALSVSKSKHNLKMVGKYKLVSRKSPSGLRLTMKIAGDSFPSPFFTSNIRSPYVSRSGKRVISRYKIRKRTSTSPIVYAPASKKSTRSSPYKVDRRKSPALRTRYKIDKLNRTRKTLKFISTRPTNEQRSYKWVKQSLRATYRPTFVSPFKLLRHSHTRTAKGGTQQGPKDKKLLIRKLASHCLQKSAMVSMRAKYRKDRTTHKYCMFYMRFGKCKRGEKCYYIHDPDKIAVCTRFLRGTCNIENCVFSHEAKKEKVPVCQHFLHGSCARDSCPYLHVNVGKDAPICPSFAEFRYCHLGEKCKKLHTDVCPNRNSQGSCPKGSRCHLRHPIKSQKPPAADKIKICASTEEVPTKDSSSSEELTEDGNGFTDTLPAYISLSTLKTAPAGRSQEMKKLKNKPNFL